MRVLLDSNVLLSAALYRGGYAAQLPQLESKANFVVSEYCLHECRRVLKGATKSWALAAAAMLSIQRFLAGLHVTVIPDVFAAPRNLPDYSDEPVVAGALASGCDVICSYNFRDLRPSGCVVLSPLGLLKRFGPSEIFKFIQPAVLGHRGTVLMLGRLNHESCLGEVLTSNGIRVCADLAGFIRVDGPDARAVAHRPIVGDQFLGFVFRYQRTGDFEAAMWLPRRRNRFLQHGQEYEKTILTTGRARFEMPVVARLVYNGNSGFSGVVLNLFGIPHYVRDADIPYIMENRCLEAIVGSRSVADILALSELIRLPDGTYALGLHSGAWGFIDAA